MPKPTSKPTPLTEDPRPLIGEPLALDLLNTWWMRDGALQDLFAVPGGLAVWLGSNGLGERFAADTVTLTHVSITRTALKLALDDGRTDDLDAVLSMGRIRATLTADGPAEVPEFQDPRWGPGWLAARSYLELLSTAPDRIRHCAHEACVLRFFDTSRNGTRRWCSMAACGNRAKASRHYARSNPGHE
ncbi:CGNR zinc finger domain-containing protein [Streptomyces sp. NPDC048504]|uniref:CGNR zinc finger domain-containing protein n=1 Tax=Streptomyces sp. NPDC048504 TaxID=3365559 RepID=UPI003717EBE7